MSHFNAGLISAYNSLTDKHLAGYFSNTRIRRHLQRAGLITRSGRIVPDKEYRHKLIQRAHHRHVRECLAQAIFHKVLEMERLHQIEIKKKLEEFARRERVRKIKVERSKRYEEGFVHILSPRPPTVARGIWKQHSGPEGEHSESSESPSSSRPNTAPGKMQRPVRLKPIHSNSTTASVRRSSPYRPLESSHENDAPFNCTMEKEPRRRLTAVEPSHGISPYCLPVINNFVTPVPPATKRKERGLKVTHSSTVRGRRLHLTTASSGADDTPVLRSSVHQSRVCVNMVYFGKTVRLSNDLTDVRDDVKVFQQHCGGENLCVYKGKLHEGETFQFISRRHRGFPFSLTFFLNGLQVERLSSCCEFKHRKGSRLGGKHGHFGFSSVEGAAPCYKCIIAMGLDKKPTPPPKRVKEDIRREESVSSPKNAPEIEMERTGEDAGSHSECETSRPQDIETPVKEEAAPEEDKDRDDYEEDFEADEERPAEEEKEKKSPSPSSEMESQVKEMDASETEDDEKNEDTRSHSGSSSSGSERDESDAEDTKDIKEDEKAEQPREDGQEETVARPVEKDEPNPEEAAATEAESSVAKDSHMDSAGDSTEIEISDTSVPSGSNTRQSDEKDAEKMIEESKHEEEQERAKSVQEKLAEAILKEAQCSSEPELSDTSTEEEEDSTHKGPQQDNKDAAPGELVTTTEQQETIAEETKCEDSDTGEVAVAQEQEDSPETGEQSDDEQEPHENRDSTEHEKAEEDEKAAEDEATADKDKSEETGEALHLLKEENVAQDEKTTEPLEETPAETVDAEIVEKDEEKEEKTAVETDVQCDETGQGAKSREEDESSVSEPDEKTDETAVPDNAEAETVTARETMEIKAESSEEREALSDEEAPVTDAEKREAAGSEDGAAAAETEVTAENSSSSPNGSGGTTVEKVADTSEENTKDESSKEEQISGKETSKDDSQEEQCEQGEEGMETSEETDEKEDKQKSEEDGEEEKENQIHVASDEIKEDESTEKREKDEGRDIQGNTAASTNNATETKENEEETVKILGEEEKVSDEEKVKDEEKIEDEEKVKDEEKIEDEEKVKDEEKVEESEKTENDETSECVENEQEDLEGREADKNEGEDESETKTAVQEHNREAEKSENENENKAEKSEDKESKNDEEDDKEKDITENPVGEGISETTEEAEKSADAGVSETADGTKSTEETPEFESVEQEAGRASDTSEKGEIDAENGEISTRAESKNGEDEGEAQPKDENDLKTKEHGEEESKSDRPAEDESTDIKELTMESEESAKKHEDDEADQAPGADEVERDAKERGDSEEKNDESTPSNSQPETAGTEIKVEPKLDDSEETERDQNGNKSDCGNENKEPDFIKKECSIEGNVDEVAAVSSGNREQSSAPVAVDLSDTASKLDEENKNAKSDIHPHTAENAGGVDLPATDGENGADAEDASKASEEGASVLLKPQAPNIEADNTEQSAAAGRGNPETLGTEDNTDLVTNWVNKHQSSKFFETFVEPLEDLREEVADTTASNSNKEETKSTELPRSESPLKMMRMPEDEESAHTDIENVPQVEEKTDMKGLMPKETEQSEESAASQEIRSEEHRGSKGDMGSPQECNDQKSAKQGINEETTLSKTEVESVSGSHHSAFGKPESVSKNQTDEKTTDNDLTVKQPQTEEGHQPTSPLGPEDINETWEKADEQNREVTETADFTTSKSDNGSQEERRNEGVEGKASNRSIGSDRKELQLIEDIKHTLSKDQLSTFSVDETLLAHSSYPLLTAATAESGH